MANSVLFFNRCFDKTRLKNFILWFFGKYGAKETIQLLENFKIIGFHHATEAGISIGVDDLKIPPSKRNVLITTEQKMQNLELDYEKGYLTEIEKRQRSIEEWSSLSEKLKLDVIEFLKATDIFNPIYMAAFSGARGNISQVRQLIGMRGLMVDPQGQVLDFPIRSNFREGLNLIEYIVSCYGARKGVVDTALRTATAGYLTRRLVDVSQHVIVGKQNCQTNRGIPMTPLVDDEKVVLSLTDRLVGRILFEDLFSLNSVTKKKDRIGYKNQEISSKLAFKISQLNKPVLLRSPLTCNSKNFICQLCYGWSLAHSAIVSIGEAVGILAGQSIGEPGTQLTMRTFHTGGIFTGTFMNQIYAPFEGTVYYLSPFQGLLVRTLKGQVGFLTKTKGYLHVKKKSSFDQIFQTKQLHKLIFGAQYKLSPSKQKNLDLFLLKIKQIELKYKKQRNISNPYFSINVPLYTTLLIRHGGAVSERDLIAELYSVSSRERRRSEKEQMFLSPISGEIRFNNLLLIEKTAKDGKVQKISYGLGIMWIIAGVFGNSFSNQQLFPCYGDFIVSSSLVYKSYILIDKSYYFDLSLLNLIQKWEDFKINLFSKNSKNSVAKFKLSDTFFFNRCLFYTNIQKIYYRNFCYLACIHFAKLISNTTFLKFINFLSVHNQFIKKNHFRLNGNKQILGLNLSLSQKFNFKSNFLLYSIHCLQKIRNQTFFIKEQILDHVQVRSKQPIFSRKMFDFKTRVRYDPFWINFTKSINSNSQKIDCLRIYHWSFYFKNKKNFRKIHEYFELQLQYIIFLNLKNTFFEVRQDKLISANKLRNEAKNQIILKIFFNQFGFKHFFINLTKFSSTQIQKKLNWVSNCQLFFLLANRQGNVNFLLSNSWTMDRNLFNHFFFKKVFELEKSYPVLILEKKLNSKIQSLTLTKLVNQQFDIKPILLNIKQIPTFHFNQNHLTCYILQIFLTWFYHQYWTCSKLNNSRYEQMDLKVGFKLKFKMNTFLNLNLFNFERRDNIRQKKKRSPLLKELFSKKAMSSVFDKKDVAILNFRKSQSFLDWVYSPSEETIFLRHFSFILTLGSFFPNGIRFDHHEIMIDSIYFDQNKLLKTHINKNFNYKHVYNLRKRFSTYSDNFFKLVVFQRMRDNLNQKETIFKKIVLNQILPNQNFFRFLISNTIKNYGNRLKKGYLTPKKFFNPLNFYAPFTLSKHRLFKKTEFLNSLQIEAFIECKCSSLLTSYCSISEKTKQKFTFKNPISSFHGKNKINKNIDFTLPLFNFSKSFSFGLVKKINFQIQNSLVLKNAYSLKLFYDPVNCFSFRNLIFLKLFWNLRKGEVISKKQEKSKSNFVLLNEVNLRTCIFTKPSPELNFKKVTMGKLLVYGDQPDDNLLATESGQIIYLDQQQLIIRKAASLLITSKTSLQFASKQIIAQDSRLFTAFYHQIKSEDIIQGIPKIEELFEARITREGIPLFKNLHTQLRQLFHQYRFKTSIFEAAQQSFEIIQQRIVNEIQNFVEPPQRLRF